MRQDSDSVFSSIVPPRASSGTPVVSSKMRELTKVIGRRVNIGPPKGLVTRRKLTFRPGENL